MKKEGSFQINPTSVAGLPMKKLLVLFCLSLPVAAEEIYEPAPEVPKIEFTVIEVLPRDASTFTQGFCFHDGQLIEGAGGYGRSELRLTKPGEPTPTRSLRLPPQVFGEGVTLFEDRIYQLTWRRQVGFVFDLKTLKLLEQFRYQGQGWGLTADGTHLIMSSGSEVLSFRDPQTFAEVKKVKVHEGKKAVKNLNELEWIDGQIFANVWHSDWIVRIDPKTGKVTGAVDCSGLLQPRPDNPEAVLNGIAYDAKSKTLYLTGKLWPQIFKVKLWP